MRRVEQLIARLEVFGAAAIDRGATDAVDGLCTMLGSRLGEALDSSILEDGALPRMLNGSAVAVYYLWPLRVHGLKARIKLVLGSHRDSALSEQARTFYNSEYRSSTPPAAEIYGELTMAEHNIIAIAPGILLAPTQSTWPTHVQILPAVLPEPAQRLRASR
jgi:hypothetical protein